MFNFYFFTSLFLSFTCCVLQEANADKVPRLACFSLSPPHSQKEEIFEKLKKIEMVNTVYNFGVPNFHVGIFCVELERNQEHKGLKHMIGSTIQKKFAEGNQLIFHAGAVGFYHVNRPKIQNQATVLYAKNPEIFLELRDSAEQALNEWNQKNNRQLVVHPDYIRGHYHPHMTLINSNFMWQHCNKQASKLMDFRSILLEKVSPLMSEMNIRFKSPNYNYNE